jgi:hypothetical protein
MNFGNPKTLARKSIVGEALGASTRADQKNRQSIDGLTLPNYFELDSKSLTAQLKGGHRCFAKHKKSRLFPALLVRSLALTTRPFERIVMSHFNRSPS